MVASREPAELVAFVSLREGKDRGWGSLRNCNSGNTQTLSCLNPLGTSTSGLRSDISSETLRAHCQATVHGKLDEWECISQNKLRSSETHEKSLDI